MQRKRSRRSAGRVKPDDPPSRVSEAFSAVSRRVASIAGTPWAFSAAVGLVIGWALSGPLFGFSNTWQLVINTSTTILTFLMVFVIQNSQNRESRALQLKLDELLRGLHGARNSLIDLEDLSEDEMDQLQRYFMRLRGQSRATTRSGSSRGRHPSKDSS
jgi:low affinity Fe/Cu permease